jgi:alkylated DNA repair dioxygenase AlkB
LVVVDAEIATTANHSLPTTSQMSLFPPVTPPGFHYRDDFIDAAEEAALLDEIGRVEFANFELRGVVAKRRVAFFGASYDQGEAQSPRIPDFLKPVMIRAAAWAGVDPDAFAMALINEYRAGAPIGWHRDAPQYDIVAGISLVSSCRMRFRPYVSPGATPTGGRRTATHEIVLAPRSAYLLTGDARSAYEHSIPPVAELRYSITFRTLRPGRGLRLPRTER